MTNNGSLEQLFTASTFPSSSNTEAASLDMKSNENSYFTISTIVLGAFIAFMTTCLNMLIILTFAKTHYLRETPSNVLIIGLAISDFGVGVLAQPLYCVYQYGTLKDNSLKFATKLPFGVVNTLLCLVSFFSLTAITVDRFLAVHLHLRYQELVTTKRYGITLACIWIFCIVWCVLTYGINNVGLWITIISIMCGTILLNLYLILKIAKIIHTHSVQIQAQHQSVQLASLDMPGYKKSINTMYIVMGVFVLCYVPFLGQGLYFSFFEDMKKEVWGIFLQRTSLILLMSNSVINPIIYCWKMEEMRNAAKRLVHGIWRQD